MLRIKNEDSLKKSKSIWTYIISILLIISGFYLVINPEQSFSNIVYYVGLVLLISGILKIVSALINKDSLILPGTHFSSGVLNSLFGIILMLNSDAAIKVIPIIIGLWLIITSTSSLAFVFNLKNNKNIINNNLLITYILKLILGIIVLTTPIITIVFTGFVIGLILIISGIYMIINSFKDSKVYKVKVK